MNKNLKIVILVTAFFLTAALSYAQPTLLWVKEHNGGDDLGKAVATDYYGNVYVTGVSYQEGAYTAKYDAQGTLVWEQITTLELNTKILVDSEQNSYVMSEYYVMKFDSSGVFQWVHPFTGYNNMTMDVNYLYITGYKINIQSNRQIYTTKISRETGNEIWARTFNAPNPVPIDDGYDIKVDSLGNIYVAGEVNHTNTLVSYFSTDVAVLKYDKDGNLLWSNIFRFPPKISDYSSHHVTGFEIANNAIYVAGSVEDSLPASGPMFIFKPFLLKYDPDGNLQWSKSYHRVYDWDYTFDFKYDSVTNALVLLSNLTINGSLDASVLKFDTDGNMLFNSIYDNPSFNDEFEKVCLDAIGNIYVCGHVNNKMAVAKYNSSGNLEWLMNYGNTGIAHGIALDNENNVLVTGFNDTPAAVFTTLKYSSTTTGVQNSTGHEFKVDIYPNPANDVLTVTTGTVIHSIMITNLTGQVIYNNEINSGQVNINTSGFDNGIYLITVHTKNGIFPRKISIVKN